MAAPLSEISSVVREVLHDNDLELTATTCFDDLPNWDSMDMVTIVVEIECRFDVQFELPEIERLATVGDLLDMIVEKQALGRFLDAWNRSDGIANDLNVSKQSKAAPAVA